MGWHLDGRVTAVFGTHTHVQTADERILPKGTACLTDVGMTGPHDSIIGVTIEAALGRFLTAHAGAVRGGLAAPARLNAVIITADPATGKATAIERLNLSAAGGRRAGRDALAERCTSTHLTCRTCSTSHSKTSRRSRSRRRASAAPPHRHRLGADRGDPRRCSSPASAMSGSRGKSRTAACGTPATCTSR